MTPLKYRIATHASLSDLGQSRPNNEDAAFADPAAGLFLVADGMGGLASGEVASKAVVEVFPKMLGLKLAELKKDSERLVREAVKDTVAEFSSMMRERVKGDARLKGMGATLVLLLVRGRFVYWGSIGDSRVYLLEGGRLRRLSRDHTITATMLELGQLTEEQAATHPFRNKLSRYMFQEGKAVAEVHTVAVKRGRLLLCSDGVSGMLEDGRIGDILKTESEPAAACRRLIDEANAAGGTDNITTVVVDVVRSR